MEHGDEGLTVNGQTTDCPELQWRTAAGWSFFAKTEVDDYNLHIINSGGMRIESANISGHWRCDGRSTCVL